MPGANILIEGTTTGAAVDLDGNFRIGNLEPGTYTLLFRYIGYNDLSYEVEVTDSEPVILHIEMTREAVGLDELLVTATGSVRSREVGTSQARITAQDFSAASASNPQEILSGRVAGATVLANSGQPGAGGTIRLRGNNSISQSNNPIIYIDGIRVEGGDSPSHQASRQTTSPLNDINPNDIESIDIVKGAAATTLYGTEASGGVIRITTKQGTQGVTMLLLAPGLTGTLLLEIITACSSIPRSVYLMYFPITISGPPNGGISFVCEQLLGSRVRRLALLML